jgi:hypothetical protein
VLWVLDNTYLYPFFFVNTYILYIENNNKQSYGYGGLTSEPAKVPESQVINVNDNYFFIVLRIN